jgi:polyphosphate kinase
MKSFTAAHFLSRELSWLEFNQRVLNEALNPSNPLLERVKFFTITSSNLDEFFEVRVAGIKQQIESDVVERSIDGRTATETFRAIRKRVREMVEQQFRCWREELVPALARNGIQFLDVEQLEEADRAWMDKYYAALVRPVLLLASTLRIPFPASQQIAQHRRQLDIERNNTAASPSSGATRLSRLVRLPREDERLDYVFMGHLVGHISPTFSRGPTCSVSGISG